MHRQVGDLKTDSHGIARGSSHSTPGHARRVASSEAVLRFIAEEISVHTYVNIMDQYRPEYHACEHVPINRRVTHKEYVEATQIAKRLQLTGDSDS